MFWGWRFLGGFGGILSLSFGVECEPVISTPPPFHDLNVRIPIMTPSKGRGFINHRVALRFGVWGLRFRSWRLGLLKVLNT